MTDFPHIILDNGKIVSPSIGQEYSMFHVNFLSSTSKESFEIFEKLSEVCNAKWPTKECPDCKGKGSIKGEKHLCNRCKGKTVIANEVNR